MESLKRNSIICQHLHPLHLEDLLKSGLSENTIQKAGICSISPDKLQKYCGSLPVASAYLIPYFNAKGQKTNFWRMRCFYPSSDNKFPKYLQPTGSGNHLYFPPNLSTDNLLNASQPLYITEGEKKALKGAQQGLVCIGLSGLWNWSNGHKELIDDFNQIPLKDRKIVIVPDNDWRKPNRHGYKKNLEQAVYELAKRLTEKGAKVFVKELPNAEEKIGLDDYLVGHTVFDFLALPEKELSFKTPLQEVEEKIKNLNIHNWREIIPDLQKLGLVEKEYVIKQLSEQIKVSKKVLEQELMPKSESKNNGKSGLLFANIKPYPEPVGSEIFDEIEDILKQHIVLLPHYYPAVTAWIIASYVFQNFSVFPYLLVTSPVKRCGKSRLLKVLYHLCNKTISSGSISSASVYRLVDKEKPTLIIDEADRFIWKNEELIGVLNAGYQKGIPVIRTNPNTLEPECFDPYCPKIIAMIRKHTSLLDTLIDRSIEVKMQRKKRSEKVKRFDKESCKKAEVIQSKILRFIIDTKIEEREVEIPEVDNDRAVEHWGPLFIVSSYATAEFQKRLEEAFLQIEEGKSEELFEIELLQDIHTILAEEKEEAIFSKDLLQKLHALEDKPYKETIQSQSKLAKYLGRFGINSESIRIGNRQARGYRKRSFEEVFQRYLNTSVTSVTKQELSTVCNTSESVTKNEDVTLSNCSQSLGNTGFVTDVTLPDTHVEDETGIRMLKASQTALEETEVHIPNCGSFLEKLKKAKLQPPESKKVVTELW